MSGERVRCPICGNSGREPIFHVEPDPELGITGCESCLIDAQRRVLDGLPPRNGVYTRLLAQMERERIEWLWPRRIPLGMLTLLIGDPGLGKSMLSLYLAALVSRDGGDVLILSAEDHASATILPRAEAAEADLNRLHVVGVRRDGIEDGLALPDDGEALAHRAREVDARLVIVDPLMAHLGGDVNSHRDKDTRRALAPLHRLAEQVGCSVLGVVHLNKMKGANPLYRAGGSIAFMAAVRSALLLARDPGDPDPETGSRRVLAHVKCNVGPQAKSLACRIEDVTLPGDFNTARFAITGTSTVTTADLLDAPDADERSERDEAADFLRSELAGGPVAVGALKSAAFAHGIGWRTVERAKKALGVEANRVSAGNTGKGRWEWSLPAGNTATGNTATPISPEWWPCENGSSKPDSGGDKAQHRHPGDMAPLSGSKRMDDVPLATPEQEAKAARLGLDLYEDGGRA